LKVRAGKGLHEGMRLDVALNNYQFNGKKGGSIKCNKSMQASSYGCQTTACEA